MSLKPYIWSNFFLILFGLFAAGCDGCKHRRHENEGVVPPKTDTLERRVDSTSLHQDSHKIAKAIYYIENSESMFGYVGGRTEYVRMLADFAQYPRFVVEQTPLDFYFINGGEDIEINHIGSSLEGKDLTTKAFRCGDYTKSNLNEMFKIALSKAKGDTVTILISDGIYDIRSPNDVLQLLETEGTNTRSAFIRRLRDGDLETMVVKFVSDFKGYYFFASKRGKKRIHHKRPFYVWIFGRAELLNEYFPESYFEKLEGFSNMARFLKIDEANVPYELLSERVEGSFRIDRDDHKKVNSVRRNRRGGGLFGFSFVVDYSVLPFAESYFEDTSNYHCVNSSSYKVKEVSKIHEIPVGLKEVKAPTHRIVVYTDGSPYGTLKVSLLSHTPAWLEESHIDTEEDIDGDSLHTFGFGFLMRGIEDAYGYANKQKELGSFSFKIEK